MGRKTPVRILTLEGLRPYTPILHLQHRLVTARHNGTLETDVILILEHTPVFTLGHNGGRENLKVSGEFLRKREIPIIKAERGGNITYHGPGQVIAYPIINLRAMQLRLPAYVTSLEEAMIRTAADYGIQAGQSPRNHGVWVGDKKLGSIGIAVRHGITFHGLALNVNLPLEPFSWISPCGLTGIGMTSLKEAGAHGIDCKDVMKTMTGHLKDILEINTVNESIDISHAALNNFCPEQTYL